MTNKKNKFFLSAIFILLAVFIFSYSALAETIAPTITEINSGEIKTSISGVTTAETDVVIFADGKFIGKAQVSGDEETNSFSFSFDNADLNIGEHKATALAINKNSFVVSAPSEEKIFNITSIAEPAITPEAVEEEAEAPEVEKVGLPQITRDNNIAEEENNEAQELIPELGTVEDNSDESVTTGLINESKNQQSKLQLNLIIFILFLIAVIAWIFWVNRELIKERKQKNLEEDTKGSNDLGI